MSTVALPHKDVKQGYELELGLWVCEAKITSLREQDLNAQEMQPSEFERLTENVRQRGTLESLPYCTSQDGGPIEVVSGHHRVRAARGAGKKTVWLLLDTLPMTRSQIRAKQIAHNAIVGSSNDEILRRMVAQIDNPDDLLATGLKDDYLPLPPPDPSLQLQTPHAAFDWRVVSFTFLPHQLETFKEVVQAMDGAQDLVGVAPVELFDDFARSLAAFARFREIRSVSTTVAVLTRIAKDLVEVGKDDPSEDEWVRLESVFQGDAMPAPAAKAVREALAKRLNADDGNADHLWMVLEKWAAEELAS